MDNRVKICRELVKRILPWYERCARSMPWRMKDPDPYWTLVSEVMLQQTRVETVIPYFQRFIQELPTLADLAAADEEILLKLWEGLGYYSRVRNLQKTARAAVERFGGKLPGTVAELRNLPGIGEYTAGAIGSIAFHLPVPAVDGNVMRVCARLLDCDKDIMDPAFRNEITELLRVVYPENYCSEFTQSLMDLGATVCIPAHPRCSLCPLSEICLGLRSGREAFLPVKKKKMLRKVEKKSVLLLNSAGGKIALRKRPDKGVLAGMWELPWLEGEMPEDLIRKELNAMNVDVLALEYSKKGKHIFTHLEWEMVFWSVRCRNEVPAWTWVTQDELLHNCSLPSAFRKFL